MDETLPDKYTYLGAALGDDGVTFEGLKLLHRPAPGDEANTWLTFHRKDDGGIFRDVTSWRASELDALLPFARAELVKDAYHSVNSFFRAGRPFERRRDGSIIRRRWSDGLVPVYRSAEGARYLNTAFVDLDSHRAGLTPGTAFGRVFDLQRAKALPDVSMFVFSGRGLWLFWLLRDERPDSLEANALPPAVRAWPENVTIYRLLERAIVTHPTLRLLGADAGAKDISRVTRLCGSINSEAGEPVRVLPQFVQGRIPTYTLAQLGEAFDVHVPVTLTKALAPTREITTRREQPKQPAKANGPRARWQCVLADLISLVALRGGKLPEGTRHMGCCALATCLRRLGIPLSEVHAQVSALAAASGLPSHEADDAVRCAVRYRTSSPAYAEISAWLQVTPEEAEQLSKLPAAGTQPRAPSVLTRTTRQRRAALLAYISALGHVPPPVASCAYLAAAGFPVSLVTVANDYARLKLPRERWRGRSPKAPGLF